MDPSSKSQSKPVNHMFPVPESIIYYPRYSASDVKEKIRGPLFIFFLIGFIQEMVRNVKAKRTVRISGVLFSHQIIILPSMKYFYFSALVGKICPKKTLSSNLLKHIYVV